MNNFDDAVHRCVQLNEFAFLAKIESSTEFNYCKGKMKSDSVIGKILLHIDFLQLFSLLFTYFSPFSIITIPSFSSSIPYHPSPSPRPTGLRPLLTYTLHNYTTPLPSLNPR